MKMNDGLFAGSFSYLQSPQFPGQTLKRRLSQAPFLTFTEHPKTAGQMILLTFQQNLFYSTLQDLF
ncbi:hypothetical protein DFO73_113169 [Cytobacillus oceanisediminis]|uniref:Uncharacterized protein n=1 Tax=Cytobacillus oceanisediminis TaxID=665099 RepID=A0A2V2ZQF5_9BACI|nr:hypothetical protein DFO73_113169 [Cytobacillus oceanisediminis]